MFIRFNRKSKAQTTAEYAILIGLVIAAAVAMQVYVKRGLQARVHDVSKLLVNQTSQLDTEGDLEYQYEPYYLKTVYTVNRTSNALATLEKPGNYIADEQAQVGRTGYQSAAFSDADAEK